MANRLINILSSNQHTVSHWLDGSLTSAGTRPLCTRIFIGRWQTRLPRRPPMATCLIPTACSLSIFHVANRARTRYPAAASDAGRIQLRPLEPSRGWKYWAESDVARPELERVAHLSARSRFPPACHQKPSQVLDRGGAWRFTKTPQRDFHAGFGLNHYFGMGILSVLTDCLEDRLETDHSGVRRLQ